MSGAVATAYVKLIPTFDGQLSSTISKQLGQVDGKSAGSKIGKGIQSGVESGVGGIGASVSSKFSAWTVAWGNIASNAMTKVAAVMGQALSDGFTGYADYEQLVGGVETLFKDSAGTVQQYAAQAYETAGMSANEYMEQVTSFSASLLQGLGGDTEAAANYADMAMRDMSDNANKMGSSMESITNAYQGFAKQNYTMLDNLKLGYGGTKSEMERLLADASKIAGVEFDIDNYSDVIQAIHVMQEEMGIAGTTAEEAQSTISGSMNMVKASWDNLLVGMFDEKADVGALFDKFADSLGTAMKNVIPRIGMFVGRLVTGLPDAISKALTSLPDIIAPTLEKMFGEKGLEMAEGLRDKLGGIAERIEGIGDKIGGIVEGISPLIEGLASVLGEVLSGVLALAEQVLGAIEGILATVQAIIDFVNGNTEVLDRYVEGLNDVAYEARDATFAMDDAVYVANQFDGERTATLTVDDQASGKLNSIMGKIASIATTHFATIAASFMENARGGFVRLHANGGFVTNGPTFLGRDANGVAHIAGEAGREWIKTHADGTTSIVPIENRRYLKPYAQEIASMIGGTGSTTVYNVSISDFAINDDAEIRNATRDYLGILVRKGAMNVG